MRLRLHIQAFLAAAILCIVERPTQVQETHALSGADQVVRVAVRPDTPPSRLSILGASDRYAGRPRAAKAQSALATRNSIWQGAIEGLKILFGR